MWEGQRLSDKDIDAYVQEVQMNSKVFKNRNLVVETLNNFDENELLDELLS